MMKMKIYLPPQEARSQVFEDMIQLGLNLNIIILIIYQPMGVSTKILAILIIAGVSLAQAGIIHPEVQGQFDWNSCPVIIN